VRRIDWAVPEKNRFQKLALKVLFNASIYHDLLKSMNTSAAQAVNVPELKIE